MFFISEKIGFNVRLNLGLMCEMMTRNEPKQNSHGRGNYFLCYNKSMYSKGFIFISVIVMIIVILTGGIVYFATLSKRSAPKIELPAKTSEDNLPSGKIELNQPKTELKPALSAPNKQDSHTEQAQKTEDPWRNPIPTAPTNLFLPIFVQDINVTEQLLSPYGIIRKSGDGGIGHGGIDFPLERGSPIYAVADGTIIKNNMEDPGGGKTVDILITPGKFQGEGWIFKYDHVALEPGLAVGSSVQKGQKIATNAFTQRGNNHIGLEYHIKNFTIAREKICWVDFLELTARQQLEDKFNQIKNTQTFIQSWQTANEESYYQYKSLLDTTKYPDGPQLCYPLGLDARTPI